ncbi:MAG: amidohydrolase family protein [Nitrospinota bacterium]
MVGARAPVVDFHIHLSREDQSTPWSFAEITKFRGPEDPPYEEVLTPEGLRRLLDEEGLDFAVALAELSPVTTGMIPNEYVAELASQVPGLIPFCNINPHLTTDPASELRRLVGEFGFRGLKLHPSYQHFYPNEPRLYPLWAAAAELSLPVLVHTGSSTFRGSYMKYSDPLHLDEVARDFPELPILMAHGGRGFWYDRAFFLAQLHENLYLEVSGLPPKRLLTYFPELEKLSHKTVFGSDWPGAPGIRKNIEDLRALPLSEGAKERILGGNAAKILKLPRENPSS